MFAYISTCAGYLKGVIVKILRSKSTQMNIKDMESDATDSGLAAIFRDDQSPVGSSSWVLCSPRHWLVLTHTGHSTKGPSLSVPVTLKHNDEDN